MRNNSQPKGIRGRDFRFDTGRDLGLTSYAIPAAPKDVKVLKVIPQRYVVDTDPELVYVGEVAL